VWAGWNSSTSRDDGAGLTRSDAAASTRRGGIPAGGSRGQYPAPSARIQHLASLTTVMWPIVSVPVLWRYALDAEVPVMLVPMPAD